MTISIGNRVSYKRLVAIGNNDVFFEDINVAAGEMIELNTSSGAIDTSDNLVMFEGVQKCFVVNGAKLKIADFLNTKIYDDTGFTTKPTHGQIVYQGTTEILVDYINSADKVLYGYIISGTLVVATAITTAVNGGGNVVFPSPTSFNGMLTHTALTTAHEAADTLTQATSGATMIVEFTDTAKTHTWGRITGGVFDTTNTVTGSGSGTAFIPTATTIHPPVWYAWTPYDNDTTIYGKMPDKAYLGCLYRGRAVLSGDPDYPNQWYMSRQLNPWDWVYEANDAQAPIAGGNGDLGQSGDIIRALIPYSDDYLIIGCANSMKVIVGDPAESGTFSEIDLTRGIFGSKSWCFDGTGNLYFWATDGLCLMPKGFRPIENLSSQALPNILVDEAIDPSIYRICLAYDRERLGILITITKLADGTNSDYFYSLKVKGFFPEDYPEECAAYSLYYYEANDDAYRNLLVGCTDGYIRCFDDTTLNDNVGATNQVINAYMNMPVMKLVEEDKEGKLTKLTFETAGGATLGTYGDSGILTYSLYVGKDAETVAEDIRDGATPFATGTITGSGRQTAIRTRARGYYLGMKISDATTNNTFVVNRILGNVIPAGS